MTSTAERARLLEQLSSRESLSSEMAAIAGGESQSRCVSCLVSPSLLLLLSESLLVSLRELACTCFCRCHCCCGCELHAPSMSLMALQHRSAGGGGRRPPTTVPGADGAGGYSQ
jgi:hypothetical protein